MLATSELACVRGDRRLFSGLGFSLESGGRLHIGGENGVGKTSLLRILCGLSPPDAGVTRWQGEPIGRLGDEYRRAVLTSHQDVDIPGGVAQTLRIGA